MLCRTVFLNWNVKITILQVSNSSVMCLAVMYNNYYDDLKILIHVFPLVILHKNVR